MNITLDFTKNLATEEQPVAIMPAELAKKLLRMYAEKLSTSSSKQIIDDYIDQLLVMSRTADLNGAINISLGWINQRELIQNVSHEIWDAYTVGTATDQISKITIAAMRTEKPHNVAFTDGRDLDNRD